MHPALPTLTLLLTLAILDAKISKLRLVEYSNRENSAKIEGSGANKIGSQTFSNPAYSVPVFSLNSKWYLLAVDRDFYAGEETSTVDIQENFDQPEQDLEYQLAKSFYISRR